MTTNIYDWEVKMKKMWFVILMLAMLAVCAPTFGGAKAEVPAVAELSIGEAAGSSSPSHGLTEELVQPEEEATTPVEVELSRRPEWQDSTAWKAFVAIFSMLMTALATFIANLLRKMMDASTAQKFAQIGHDICAFIYDQFPDNDLPRLALEMMKEIQKQLGVSEIVAKRIVSGYLSDKNLLKGDSSVFHR
jgi:hypothetical protein